MRKNTILVCCEIFQKNRFFGSRVGAEKSQKIREIMSFSEVVETSAEPKLTIPRAKSFIFSSSKSFKTILRIRGSQKKALGFWVLHQQNFSFFSQKFTCGCRNFWVPWYPKKNFFLFCLALSNSVFNKTSAASSSETSLTMENIRLRSRSPACPY